MIRRFLQWYESGRPFRLIQQHDVRNNLKRTNETTVII